ncbi:MAG: c-type cytochrome, partial [Planctomycetota bacterium]
GSLLRMQNEEVPTLLMQLVEEPPMRSAAIRGMSIMEVSQAPTRLLKGFRTQPIETRMAILETLSSRRVYAPAVVGALKDKTVLPDDLRPHVRRSLSLLLGESFTSLIPEPTNLSGNREQEIQRFRQMITADRLAAANVKRGHAVYKTTCGNCHKMYGEGGDIGPDLTGSNRRNLDYLLLNSVAPSYDVPEGYRMTIVQTVDGRAISGVVAEEDSRRLVLKTVAQPRTVVLKDDIEFRKVSEKSMMPEGQLQQLKPQQLFDLVRFLQTHSADELVSADNPSTGSGNQEKE